MAYRYRIGFLGYGQLTQLAQEVLSELSWPDTEIQVMNCTADTLQACVEQGRRNGCEVFVGGAANAAEFVRQGQGHLVEIPVGDLDYLTALHSALERGCRPAIVLYYRVRLPDMAAYERLLGDPVTLLTYEDTQELEEKIAQTDCDMIIGASHAVETAEKLGKAGILLYPGKPSIAQALEDARRLARQLHQEQKNQTILRSIVNNSTFGVMVCNAMGEVILFNRAAQQLTGFSGRDVRGRHIDQIFPTLKTSRFLAGTQEQQDGYHLIQDTMFRCVQTKIQLREESLGVLTTFYMDTRSRRRNLPVSLPESKAQATFVDWMACCAGLDGCTRQALQYAHVPLSLTILGEEGSGREWLAQCIHNAAFGENSPYVRINFAAFSSQDAGRLLLGMEQDGRTVESMLEFAQQGTVVLEHLDQAQPQALSCLMDVMRHQRIKHLGGQTAIPLHVRFVTLATPEEAQHFSPALRELCGILTLNLPPLREHPADIPALFMRYLRQYTERAEQVPRLSSRMEQLLSFYHWPGNLEELSAVCQRYLYALSMEPGSTVNTRCRLLTNAIGEQALFQSLLLQYPALSPGAAENPGQFQAGVAAAKEILGYGNAALAEKLGLSRTTLWRKLSSGSSS
ncbi:MAG: PrpR N-terminal domain-containing protein [Flintibacter sp.]|uniref:PrpR N-terminal domain-containing protein n=1 Tax=Flintibacter TaxID=1918454 RepID=UPI002D7E4EDC|nr:PrpR N-terminal domain-containing protein [Flintibacter sp.]MCI7157849.1 PrpR N-terminal domain-containing protein [Flintibacter sp.]